MGDQYNVTVVGKGKAVVGSDTIVAFGVSEKELEKAVELRNKSKSKRRNDTYNVEVREDGFASVGDRQTMIDSGKSSKHSDPRGSEQTSAGEQQDQSNRNKADEKEPTGTGLNNIQPEEDDSKITNGLAERNEEDEACTTGVGLNNIQPKEDKEKVAKREGRPDGEEVIDRVYVAPIQESIEETSISDQRVSSAWSWLGVGGGLVAGAIGIAAFIAMKNN